MNTTQHEGAPSPRRVALGSGAAYTLAGQLVSLGAAFLTSILTARTLGATGKGELALLVQVPLLVATVFSLGSTTANAYYVGRKKRTVQQAFSDSLLVVGVACVVVVPATVIIARMIGGLDAVTTSTLVLAAVIVPLTLTAYALSGIVMGVGDVKALAVRQALASASAFPVILVLALTDRLTVTSAVLVAMAASMATVILLISTCKSHTRSLLTTPSTRRIKSVMPYALRAHVSTLASQLDKRQDIIVLGFLATPAAVGIYSVGVVFAELLWQIPRSLTTPLLARSLQEGLEEGAEKAATAARLSLLIMLAAFTALAVVIGPLINIAYTSAFAQATGVFFLLCPGIVVYGLGSVLAGYLIANGHLYPRLAVSVAVINLAGNVALIPLLGVFGAALASTLSYTVGGVYLIGQFASVAGISVSEILRPRSSDLTLLREQWSALRSRRS